MTSSHELLAIDKQTGEVRWRSSTGNATGNTRGWGTALAGDVVAMSDREIYAFDRQTGALRWSFAPAKAMPGYSLLTSDSSSIYVGSFTRGWVFALDPATGAVRWETQLDTSLAAIAVDPVVHDGTLYVPLIGNDDNRAGGIFALDAGTGQVKWQRSFDSDVPGAGRGGQGPVSIAGDLVIVAVLDGSLRAFSRLDGTVRWMSPRLDGLVSVDDLRPTAVVGDLLIASSLNQTMSAHEAATGRLVWRMEPPHFGSIVGWLHTDGEHVYANSSGSMIKIDRAGNVIWRRGDVADSLCFRTGAAVEGDRIYASGCDAVYALRK